MTINQVEWILLVRYTISAHRAIYGRLPGGKYTKDYIQLYRTADFSESFESAFPKLKETETTSLPIRFVWPTGSAEGTIFKRSADRPHLAWETNKAPAPWRMSAHASEATAETIPGTPSHRDPATADEEFNNLSKNGIGQPYLIAVKLKDESDALHLRVHVANPSILFSWADLNKAPAAVQKLASLTTDRAALAWQSFAAVDAANSLHFDTSKKIDPWIVGSSRNGEASAKLKMAPFSEKEMERSTLSFDALAESMPFDNAIIERLEESVNSGDFSVPDTTSSVKVRGSAQRVFSEMVKRNYGWSCALTGITTREFLIASHIVPWSVDHTIRLDPSNGICLSILADRAFENGFLLIEDDLSVKIDWSKIGSDVKLGKILAEHDGAKLNVPKAHPPNVDFLRRRRALLVG